MITKLGMSDNLGPIVYGTDQEEVFLGRDFSHTANYSDETAHLIDTEIKTIIENAYNVAYKILTDNLDKLHFIADYLVSHETIEEAQFKAIMESDAPTIEEIEAIAEAKKQKSDEDNKVREAENAEKAKAEAEAAEESETAEELNADAVEEAEAEGEAEGEADEADNSSDEDKPE